MDRVTGLANVLGLSTDELRRHLILPLASPMTSWPLRLPVPEVCKNVFAISDGFRLFEEGPNGFIFWSSQDYIECGYEVLGPAGEEGLFPFFGEVPHLTSISLPGGSVVSTDWEVYRMPEHGWGKVIATSLQTFMRTLVQVRENYGYDESHPKDWWHPYAAHGFRYDSE